ncbi:surfactin synthase thioesterase subunit [Nonomuraea polychroma]|uniref:Surfactin synthase thioesterase subunit n=1 Tax=Nonomuraea polychroma TaxID=46176 RepID=A0A438LYZ9_9ACTN|nr:alpha/beta fold hydrolase [Nonomuraea polychroma]RVX38766.1 surfactin synthase thioesterase subunit [Nonomuraea polychroma]
MSTNGEWVRRFHAADGSGVRLVVFPHAGGSASYYFAMSQGLAPGVETVVLQYPGRQDRFAEGCIDDLGTLADRAFDALRGWDDRPLAFFGHSMGSIVAFEVARRFQERGGGPPAWLFASGYPAPSRLRGGDVHLRDDAGIVAELTAVGGIDPAWLKDEGLLATIMPPLRGDYTAIETHPRTYGVRLDCPITALVAQADPYTTVAESESWREHTSRAFDLRVYPGGHFYLEQHRAELVDTIAATLKGVAAGARP